jgi:acyl-CoA synthetase (AMP-forming)/AMP-acid ligase II
MPNGSGGILVIKRPWPSMIRTIWNDPERFKKSYFPEELKGYYLAGDGAVRSADRGYFRITGRIDDVLNVSGHRMGTMEIESALVAKTDLVAEAAVVGRPDDVTGEAICAFVVLKRPRPTGDEAKADRQGAARLGGQGNRPHCQAQGHPLWRQPAQDPQRQDHAPPAAQHGQGRSHHPGHQHAGKSRNSGSVVADQLIFMTLVARASAAALSPAYFLATSL